jgi:glucose dehydrogenase
LLCLGLALAACGEKSTGSASSRDTIDDARLLAAAKEPQNWLTHGGTYLEQRFSTLTRSTRRTWAI